MRLLDNMFLVDGDAGLHTVLRLNASHPVYAAHFPGHPITPGVCLLKMVGELMERLTGRRLSLAQIANLKFVLPVVPEHDPVVTVDFTSVVPSPFIPTPSVQADRQTPLTAKGTVSVDGRVATKFSLVWHTS